MNSLQPEQCRTYGATVERRRLGRTGHESSVAILGGAAFWATETPDEARPPFELALDAGVNHLDIAPQYGNAERVVGPLIPAVRDQLFVAGKTLRSNPDGVEAQFDDTRRLLGCEALDLYQAHGVTDLDVLEARAEAIDRIVALRDRGATRFAGITGHDLTAPRTFSEALRRWDLDTVMFPVYPRLWADPVYRSDAEALLATCVERDVGVMAIKAVARRPWADGRSLAASLDGDPSTEARWATSWYEPVRGDAIARGVAFALSTPGVHCFCTPGDTGLLPVVLAAANAHRALSDDERAAAVAQMADEPVIFPIPR
jgi:aryl-alcohol dehydrogenase-like predicted oxidoreductase